MREVEIVSLRDGHKQELAALRAEHRQELANAREEMEALRERKDIRIVRFRWVSLVAVILLIASLAPSVWAVNKIAKLNDQIDAIEIVEWDVCSIITLYSDAARCERGLCGISTVIGICFCWIALFMPIFLL